MQVKCRSKNGAIRSVEIFDRKFKSAIDFANSGNHDIELDIGEPLIYELAGWYENAYDETLVKWTCDGNIEALEKFIREGKSGLCSAGEEAKEYLKNVRFDDDGIATNLSCEASGWSLLNAAAKGQPKIVEFLIKEVGMDVDIKCYGVTPIFCTMPSIHDMWGSNYSQGRLEAAQEFINNGADLSHQVSRALSTTLPAPLLTVAHCASYINNASLRRDAMHLIVTSMIESGVDINMRDKSGKTAADTVHSLYPDDLESYQILTGIVARDAKETAEIGANQDASLTSPIPTSARPLSPEIDLTKSDR